MPKAKERPYPVPGKTPANTPAPMRATDEDLRAAYLTIFNELRRLRITSMDMTAATTAGRLHGEFSRAMHLLRQIRTARAEDIRYAAFEL